MQQHQNPGEPYVPGVFKNLYKETECLRTFIERGNLVGHEIRAFDGRRYPLDEKYRDLGMTPELLQEWVDDPEYHALTVVAGKTTHVDVPDFVLKKFISQARNEIPVDWDDKDTEIMLMVQYPGQMFPLHYDRFKSIDYDIDKSQERSVQRWMVMIYDQQPGQCFFMENQSLSWRAGDVLTWEQTYFHHGSANFGYWPKWSLRITGIRAEPDHE